MKQRTIHTDAIREAIDRLLYRANFVLPPEVREIFSGMKENEPGEIARMTLSVLEENALIAKEESLPLCQDCGAVIIFLELGQQVCIEGGNINDEIQCAVGDAYKKYYLRKSIVGDPLQRENTGTNTPCSIHTDIVPGNSLAITAYLKGGGSENMSRLNMFRPTASIEEISDFIEHAVIEAGPNPCPPLFLGIGIGGTADTAVLNSKKAVLRDLSSGNPDPYYDELEKSLYHRLNRTMVGPLGMGGSSTVAKVFIKPAATHIAILPVALNMNCHSLRYAREVL
jgi:fumarate hydratase subunit alpha